MRAATTANRRFAEMALTCALAVTAPARAHDAPVALTAQGPVTGKSVEGTDIFMGIPYAKPPVGNLRWRAPQLPAPWTAPRDATRPGAICPQVVRPGSSEPAPSEDCLFVNVWRPAGTKPRAKLPVMLWYHGGGMVFGSGSQTDGRYMAQKGVILVSMNYRLGQLGVFAHPALTAENPKALTGNYTLMDSVAALKWARANIARFGGDPQNVTIFGFSAGAQLVNTLMVTPSARGLFAKAITQSGLGRNYGHQGANRILPVRGPAALTGEKAGLALAKGLGIEGTGLAALKALRAVPPEQLKLASSSLPGSMIDGVLLPEPVPASYRTGREARVPQIIGRTICERCGVDSIIKNTEATFVRAGKLRPLVTALYGGEDAKTAVEFASDLDHVEPARYLARFHSRTAPTWNYVFNYTPESKRGEKSGPSHGDDMPYIFGTIRNPASSGFEPTEMDYKISDAELTYWTNFAKNSDPGTAAGVTWPRFRTPTAENVMVFTNDGPKVDSNFSKARLDLAEQVNDSFQPQSYVAR